MHDWLTLLRTQTKRFAEVIGQGDLDPHRLPSARDGRCATSSTTSVACRPADAPAWTLDEGDPTAGFWRRRQVHETAIHTWDAATSCGEPQAIEPFLAWDGVEEVVEVLYPRQVRLGRVAPLAGAVRLVATDVPGDLTLGSGDAFEVRHRAEVLLRLLWHRVDPATEPVGPEAAAILASAVTP